MTLDLFRSVRADSAPLTSARRRELGFFPTPLYLAEAIVERYFPDLDATDTVLEPFAGTGRFLRAIPAHVPAVGIELDPTLAAIARASSGRPVLTGGALTVPLDMRPTAVVSNPPFSLSVFTRFLDRVFPVLPMEARVGMIVPAAFFQTSRTLVRLARQWSLRQELIPRDVYARLSLPLCFCLLSKTRQRTLVGFAFYHDVAAVRDLSARTQALLADAGQGSVWRAVVTDALARLGGTASLDAIYDVVAGRRPTQNRWWKEKVRQTLALHCRRVAKGRYALAA
ncbi:MAG: class I SAM-dependent methyltransferase [Gemmatimonadaceae bacterium]|nr:class I SAM-dependent methyltransferase [Gemmatimonadaceae bacterium]